MARISAAPARLPTTLPTTLGVGRGAVGPDEPEPAAAVLTAGSAVFVGPPAPPTTPVPPVGDAVALACRDESVPVEIKEPDRLDMTRDAESDTDEDREALPRADSEAVDDPLARVEFETGRSAARLDTDTALPRTLVGEGDALAGAGLTCKAAAVTPEGHG